LQRFARLSAGKNRHPVWFVTMGFDSQTQEFTMPKTPQDTLAGKEKLVADLQRVIADAEELMQATAHQTEGKIVELRERISDNLRDARHKLGDAEDAIKEKTREIARATDDYVHEKPWSAIGVAAGVGLVIGLLIGRR
jgi:ElaB/YqjD/DUF883 family membrane-anchored ribosome-binding protein